MSPWIEEAGRELLELLVADPDLVVHARRVLGITEGVEIGARDAVRVFSRITVGEQALRFERSGWVVLAVDVWGLPWYGRRGGPSSHGAWGRHEACGQVQKLAQGALDCGVCGPEPGSRSYSARRDEPHLLYLVRHRRLVKFGRGGEARVRAHQAGGAEVLQVLRGAFAQVVLAEDLLKQNHSKALINRRKWGMINTFGAGTEVVRRGKFTIDLMKVLPAGEDVTHWFKR